MEFSDLYITFTDRCNFNCDYCYQRDNQTLHDLPLKEAFKMLDFFYPYLRDETNYLSFYGGEPLLEFGKIKKTVEYNEEKRKEAGRTFIYSMTTNGSLITDDIIDFFEQYKFRILLSLDGKAQETHRKENSFDRVMKAAQKMIESPSIDPGFNCVVTPETVPFLSESVGFFLETGISRFFLSPQYSDIWNDEVLEVYRSEMEKVRKLMVDFYREEEGKIPLRDFSETNEGKMKVCMGAYRRMCLAADSTLWGCNRAMDCYREQTENEFYNRYCFGKLDNFIRDHEIVFLRIYDEYMKLTQNINWMPGNFCLNCELASECWVCPIAEVFKGNIPGHLSQSTCRIRQIVIGERRQFYKDIGKENP